MWHQYEIELAAKPRGFHLISEEIIEQLPALARYRVGLLNLFIQHTSASLSINENADPTVRHDLEQHFNHTIPENAAHYLHILEGMDDMPAHIKCSIIGANILVPICNGALALGMWQGLYLGEHRNKASGRRIIATLNGE